MIHGLISIIVPVYNVQPYIGKCLDSLLNQTYKNIEIICINDGSEDGSEKILEQYTLMDKRVRVFYQVNSGVSSARNLGLDHVRGEYFGFIDPDDYIALDMYECLLKAINKNNADISCCSYCFVKEEKVVSVSNKHIVTADTVEMKKFLKYVYMRDSYKAVGGFVQTRLFRTCRFKKSAWNVRFENEICYGEGTLFLANCMVKARKIVYIDKPMYYYVQREKSAMHNYKRLIENMGPLQAYSKIISALQDEKISWRIIIWVKRFYTYHASVLLEYAEQIGWHENDEKIKYEIKKYLLEYILTNLIYPARIVRILKLISR